jgi:hypothetical protein
MTSLGSVESCIRSIIGVVGGVRHGCIRNGSVLWVTCYMYWSRLRVPLICNEWVSEDDFGGWPWWRVLLTGKLRGDIHDGPGVGVDCLSGLRGT